MRHLFDVTRLKGVTLKNRFVRSATWERLATADGRMTAPLFRIYEELARGQVGLIMTSYAFVTRDEQPNPGMLGIYDDRGLDEYRLLTDRVHAHGSAIMMQLAYGGTQTSYRPEQRVILGPSAVAEMATGVVAREMTHVEIQAMIAAFGNAAVRARAAGFDGVQLHAAHGYFLGQWLSPYHNQRTDDYGGSVSRRARFILETYAEIRRRCGDDFLVMIKINSSDFVPGGATFAECSHVCTALAERGIDAIEVSGGILASRESLRWARSRLNTPADEGYFAEAAARLAEMVDVPVILVGGLKSLDVMERLLAESRISYFALCRALMTEPYLISRWQQGDRSKARCLSCNQCRDPQGNICILHRQDSPVSPRPSS